MKFYTKIPDYIQCSLRKFLWVMKLIVVLLIAGIMQVSASVYGQKISIERKSIAIKEVFKEIKNQTGYDVLWRPGQLDAEKKIAVNFIKAPIEKAIATCLSGQNLDFNIDGNTIVILKKHNSVISNKYAPADSVIYRGIIVDETGKPLPGASVKLKGSRKVQVSTIDGYFVFYGPKSGTLVISYIGYLPKEVALNGSASNENIRVTMTALPNQLGQVNIVSTGYQDLPKERATGSFEVVTAEQLQHSVDPNLLKRLEGITTSMDFQNQLTPLNSASYSSKGLTGLSGVYKRSVLANLTIRGRNTLGPGNSEGAFGNNNGQVLVVIDGIASAYSIDQIDPNNVESLTILKDAAAASIWGSRAANGVIVVKTKRGAYGKPMNVSFNTSVNITDKINLFYKKYMSTSEYIDAEIFKYNAANITYRDPTSLIVGQNYISPVAEILNEVKLGRLNIGDATAQLNVLRGNDVRNDFEKYIQRKSVTQNYNLAIGGGSKNIAYRLSGSYNNTLNNTVNSSLDRLTFSYNTSIHLLKNLDAQADITYGRQRTQDQYGNTAVSSVPNGAYNPYTRLADDNGNPLVIPFKYRPIFIKLLGSTYGSNILDLTYTPLVDMNQSYTKTNAQNINLNFGLNYKLNQTFSISTTYNNNIAYNEQISLAGQNSFYMRDLINRYTSPGTFVRNIPDGGFYNPTTIKINNQTFRGLLNVNKSWKDKHVLSAIAGIDVSQTYNRIQNNKYYGFNERSLTTQNALDYKTYFRLLFADPQSGLSFAPIINGPASNDISDFRTRTFSSFANVAYTYDNKYTISGSIRKDMSSQFGLGTNKGGTPFYSVGGSWNIANEKFYNLLWLPKLQLRTTFGYNGNVNPAISAVQIINYSSNRDYNTNLYYASTTDATGPTNNNLRPEKTAVLNFGLDFGLRNNRISGSIEYYDKRTTDVIENGQIDPTTGFSVVPLNTASLHGNGIDLTLNSLNLQSGLFRWNSNFLFSYNRVKVSKLFGTNINNNTAGRLISGSFGTYNEGADLSRLFAYKWAGLDPVTGDPQGYINDKPVSISASSKGNAAYNEISTAPGNTLRYFGSAVPVYYGSFRNTFSYGSVSLSVNLLYKLGYYFRRPNSDVVKYSSLYENNLQGIEFQNRWQKPGDELNTNVPSLTYPVSQNRDNFYYNSEINVLKADHIRLQELNLSYGFGKNKWFVKNLRIYANVNNLGIIWKANKLNIDPEVNDYPNPRSYSLGLSANF